MTARITLQPYARTANITSDGHELQQLPYPFHVAADGGVGRQDWWKGEPTAVIGFTRDPNLFELHFRWDEIWPNPALCVGMYAITASADGTWATHLTAIQSATPNSEWTPS